MVGRIETNMRLAGWGLVDLDSNDGFDRALDDKRVRISEGWVGHMEREACMPEEHKFVVVTAASG